MLRKMRRELRNFKTTSKKTKGGEIINPTKQDVANYNTRFETVRVAPKGIPKAFNEFVRKATKRTPKRKAMPAMSWKNKNYKPSNVIGVGY
jgi:hypothetical protein